MDDAERDPVRPETEAEREARYFAGYEAIPDDDEDFKAIERLAIESLRDSEDDRPTQ